MISLYYTGHTKAYNKIYTACNIVEAIYSFTLFIIVFFIIIIVKIQRQLLLL